MLTHSGEPCPGAPLLGAPTFLESLKMDKMTRWFSGFVPIECAAQVAKIFDRPPLIGAVRLLYMGLEDIQDPDEKKAIVIRWLMEMYVDLREEAVKLGCVHGIRKHELLTPLTLTFEYSRLPKEIREGFHGPDPAATGRPDNDPGGPQVASENAGVPGKGDLFAEKRQSDPWEHGS